MKKKRILITGGAGSIGSELTRQLSKNNKVYILDNNETGAFDLAEELQQKDYWVHCRVGDIRNKETVRSVFSDFKPQIVFHAAAYKHVTPMEWFPEEAVETNIRGLINVVSAAKNLECVEKFVFISTDKAVNSSSIMGASKRFGEIVVKNQGSGFVVVRFGNVMGSRGSVIPIWQRQLDMGEPITITDERMERFMMTIESACQLVIKAAEIGKGGEIIILDMGKRHNVLEAAKDWLSKLGIPDHPIKNIGVRPGEQIVEDIMFEEEKTRAIKQDNLWIIK